MARNACAETRDQAPLKNISGNSYRSSLLDGRDLTMIVGCQTYGTWQNLGTLIYYSEVYHISIQPGSPHSFSLCYMLYFGYVNNQLLLEC